MAPNFIIQCLEEFGDGFEFERLCNDIIHLHYRDFEPAGGVHDSGADGRKLLSQEEEPIYFKLPRGGNQSIIFQYSLQKSWEAKVKGTLKKLKDNQITYTRLVLVSSQPITEIARVKIQAAALKDYGKSVDIHGQEFLRVYLEDPAYAHLLKYFASFLEQMKRFEIDTTLFTELPRSERQKRRALVLLNACVRSSEGQQVRESAALEVILGCIYGSGTKKVMTKQEILDGLTATFGSQGLSDKLIDSSLENLIATARIRRVNGGVRLSEQEYKRIEEKVNTLLIEDHKFYDLLTVRIKALVQLDDEQERTIRFAIAQGINRAFLQKGVEIAGALEGSAPKMNLNDYPELNIIINGCLVDIKQLNIRDATEQVLRQLFTNPSMFERSYLFGIAESFLIYGSFNLDPQGRILDLEFARSNVLLVDTDIVIQILAGEASFGRFYRRMLESTKNIGIVMYCLPHVIEEFVYKVDKNDKDFVLMNRPGSLSKHIAEQLGDIFETYFGTDLHTTKTWDQYISSLIGGSKLKKERVRFVERRLETEFGINVRDLEKENVLRLEEINAFATDIANLREVFRTYKHDDLYRRDAISALIVDSIRNKTPESNPKLFWLLSNDSALAKVWEQRTGKRAAFFPPVSWFQYISHFPKSGANSSDFATMMNALTMSPKRPQVPRNLIILLIRLGVNISNYSSEALRKLSEQLYGDFLWRDVIESKPTQISEEKTTELGHKIGEMLTHLSEVNSSGRSMLASQVDELSEKEKASRKEIDRLLESQALLRSKLKVFEEKERRRQHYLDQLKGNRKKEKKPRKHF